MRHGRFYPWYVVGVLLLVNALAYLDRQVMSILISPIQAELGFSDTQMGIVIGPAFMSLFLLAGLPMGQLADRHNRSLLLAGAILLWSLGTLMSAVADSFALLSASRALVGLGEACVVPAAYSLVADYFPAERRARAIAWVTIGMAVGAGCALFLGGLLLRTFDRIGARAWPMIGVQQSWSMVLALFAAAGLLVMLLVLTVIDPRQRKPEEIQAAAPTAGGFFLFLRQHRMAVTMVLTPYVLLTFMQVAMIVWVPTLLNRRLGMDPADAATLYGTLTLIIPIFFALCGGWIADYLMRRHAAGPYLLVTWLTPLFLPGVLLFALSQSQPLVIAGLVITLAVGGVCTTTVYAAVQAAAPAVFRGRILALYGLLAQLAGIGFGPPLVGFVSDHVFGNKAMLHLAVILSIAPAWIIAVLVAIAGRRHYADLRRRAELATA